MTRSLPLLCLALAAACSWAAAEEAEFTVASSYATQPRLVLSLDGKPQDDYAVEASEAVHALLRDQAPGQLVRVECDVRPGRTVQVRAVLYPQRIDALATLGESPDELILDGQSYRATGKPAGYLESTHEPGKQVRVRGYLRDEDAVPAIHLRGVLLEVQRGTQILQEVVIPMPPPLVFHVFKGVALRGARVWATGPARGAYVPVRTRRQTGYLKLAKTALPAKPETTGLRQRVKRLLGKD